MKQATQDDVALAKDTINTKPRACQEGLRISWSGSVTRDKKVYKGEKLDV